MDSIATIRKHLFAFALTLGCLFFTCGIRSAEAITLSISNVVGANISFDGNTNTFQFADSFLTPGVDFQVTLSSGGAGDSVGLFGSISGVYTIGAISPDGSGGEFAPVTGVGTLTISDGVTNLVATCTWTRITTNGTNGGLDGGGSFNLTSVSYSGTNSDLKTLAAAAAGKAILSFQFIPGLSLTQLTADGTTNATSYSATLTATPVGSIGDFVWNDLNYNGIQDAGEPGIPGVTLILKDQNGIQVGTAVTDANGHYLFSGLVPGTYTVDVVEGPLTSAGYVRTKTTQGTSDLDSNPHPTTVTLVAGGLDDLTIDFGYVIPVGQIGNFVWRDNNENGIQDAGEPGIFGVTLLLEVKANDNPNDNTYLTYGTTTTDAQGGYLFTGLPAGTYRVSIVPAPSPGLAGLTPTYLGQGTPATDSNSQPAYTTLPFNTSSDLTLDFGYFKPSSALGDFVWVDTNGNGIQDAGEPGLPNVTVNLYAINSSGQRILPATTGSTDANGIYGFTGLRGGTYEVEVVDSSLLSLGYTRTTSTTSSSNPLDSNVNPFRVTVGVGESNLTLDFGYIPPPTGKIGDFVWNDLNKNGIQDAGEPGIPGIKVTLTGSNLATPLVMYTDANGNYLFSHLYAGTYTVTVDTVAVAALGFNMATPSFQGGDTSKDSNGSPATVTLPTNLSSNLTIDFGYYKFCPSVFTTFTMGGWGAAPAGNNPGTVLSNNFTKVYPKGLVIGTYKYKLTLTSQLAVQNFLPTGTTPKPLTANYTNPTLGLGTLVGQVTALRLGLDFSNAGILPAGLKNAKFISGAFTGKTVGYVEALAEYILSGAPLKGTFQGASYNVSSYSVLSDACALVNQNYDSGNNSGLMTP